MSIQDQILLGILVVAFGVVMFLLGRLRERHVRNEWERQFALRSEAEAFQRRQAERQRPITERDKVLALIQENTKVFPRKRT